MLLGILMVKKLLESLWKRTAKKQIKTNLEYKNYLEEKAINDMSNGKALIIHLAPRTCSSVWNFWKNAADFPVLVCCKAAK